MTAWLIGALGAVVAVVAAWLRGRGQGRADAQARADAAYRETRERMDDAGEDVGDLPADNVARRLRDHAKR